MNITEPRKAFRDAVRDWLASMPARHGEVLLRRVGALNGGNETLQQVGDDLGVTRERVRQIEKLALKRGLALGVQSYGAEIGAALETVGGAAEAFELEARYPVLEGLTEYLWVIKTLQELRAIDRISLEQSRGAVHLLSYGQREWQRRLSEARTAVARLITGPTRPDLESVEAVIGSYFWAHHSAAAKLAEVIILKNALISTARCGTQSLISLDWSMEDFLEVVLREIGEPAHFTTIHRYACDRFGHESEVRSVHNACGYSERLYLYGRGVFGLLEHLRLSSSLRRKLAEEIERIVAVGETERQWHAYELLSLVLDSVPDAPQDMSPYELSIVIKTVCPSVKTLGRMVFQSDRASRQARIDVRQAVVSILRSAGRPLSDEDILERLGEHRGFSAYTVVLQPTDMYARTASGKIGLVERDFGVANGAVDAILRSIVYWCKSRGYGIHPAEIRSALTSFDSGNPDFVNGVVAYARRSPHLRIAPAGYIFPSDWPNSGRLTIVEALMAIAERAPSRLWRVEDLLSEVVTLTHRHDYQPADLSGRLWTLEFADYSATARMWCLHKI